MDLNYKDELLQSSLLISSIFSTLIDMKQFIRNKCFIVAATKPNFITAAKAIKSSTLNIKKNTLHALKAISFLY